MTKTSDKLALIALVWLALSMFDGGGNPFAPAPIDAPGLNVLIVEETEARHTLPFAQVVAMGSVEWKEYVKAKSGEWRQYDSEADLKNDDAKWRQAFARPRTSLPWLVVSNGKTGSEGPLPANLDALLSEIKKYGE